MYISVKLPSAFGSFNRLRKENYPFNNLFTSYLAAVSRLGLSRKMDVDELVGYIEDTIFDGQRLPDVPEGEEPVNIRYKTDNPDVIEYIGGSELTNRMAVMYIARMTLRLSVAYGMSLFRLTRLINDLNSSNEIPKVQEKMREQPKKEAVKSKEKLAASVSKSEEPVTAVPRVSRRAAERTAVEPEVSVSQTVHTQMTSPISNNAEISNKAEAAMDAINELERLTAQAGVHMDDDQSGQADDTVVETNPFLKDFMG